ncbi:MAG: hypothetical protein JWN95_442 [Frankiales bacterium]|nr:hypothetical protein [Frankiales bacterium]
MLPDTSDETLLSELTVIVTTGWNLPARPTRQEGVRHLLLLVPPPDSTSYRRAAQRLLVMIDVALRNADDSDLGEDDRIGCRILLGLHPEYRTETSPIVRRTEAAHYLVPNWRGKPPRDAAVAFQRRHQQNVLRQVLQCLKVTYGAETDLLSRDYDLVSTRRRYVVGANRQVMSQGETAVYRVRLDDLETLTITESVHPEGVLETKLEVSPLDNEFGVELADVEALETQPGRRAISFRLGRPVQAGQRVQVSWQESIVYGADAPQWQRDWVAVSAPNDNFEAEVSVRFADDVQLPDVCWWYVAQPDTDVTEIGPRALDELFDLRASRRVLQHWTSAETERRLDYGLLWVWLDDPASVKRWQAAFAELA